MAKRKAIHVNELRDETFISFTSKYSPVLRRVVDDYLTRSGIRLMPAHEAETLPMVISLSRSTGGVAFLPAYMGKLLPSSVVGRPLLGKAPTITLALGYSKSNSSPLLQHFLSETDYLIAGAAV